MFYNLYREAQQVTVINWNYKNHFTGQVININEMK
jgi:hypothetical protein